MGDQDDQRLPGRGWQASGDDGLPADTEGERGDSLIIERAVLLEITGETVELHACGMSTTEGFEWLRAFVKAHEQTKGMTKQ